MEIFSTLAIPYSSMSVTVRERSSMRPYTGHAGWWYLIVLTGIGAILLLVWFLQDSQPDNQYGPSPKGYSAAPMGYGAPQGMEPAHAKGDAGDQEHQAVQLADNIQVEHTAHKAQNKGDDHVGQHCVPVGGTAGAARQNKTEQQNEPAGAC